MSWLQTLHTHQGNQEKMVRNYVYQPRVTKTKKTRVTQFIKLLVQEFENKAL